MTLKEKPGEGIGLKERLAQGKLPVKDITDDTWREIAEVVGGECVEDPVHKLSWSDESSWMTVWACYWNVLMVRGTGVHHGDFDQVVLSNASLQEIDPEGKKVVFGNPSGAELVIGPGKVEYTNSPKKG